MPGKRAEPSKGSNHRHGPSWSCSPEAFAKKDSVFEVTEYRTVGLQMLFFHAE